MYFKPIEENKIKEYVHLWNQVLGKDFPMREELFRQNSFKDINVLQNGSFMALNEQNEVVGFIIAKLFKEKLPLIMKQKIGWIQVLVVHSQFQGKGIGTYLLKKAEDVFRENGVEKILLGKDVWHYFPGIPSNYEKVKQWFKRKGYKEEGEEVDLIYNVQENHSKKILFPSIYQDQFEILKENEKEKLINFLHHEFPGRWEYEAIKYFEYGGTGREFLVLKQNKNIVGFCRINDHLSPFIAQNVYWAPLFKERLGGIGPLGIKKDFRKKGYGISIVQAAVSQLLNRDIKHIVIDWTGLVSFYEKLGFKIWKTYSTFYKEV